SVDEELASLDTDDRLPRRTRLLRREAEAQDRDDEAEISHIGRFVDDAMPNRVSGITNMSVCLVDPTALTVPMTRQDRVSSRVSSGQYDRDALCGARFHRRRQRQVAHVARRNDDALQEVRLAGLLEHERGLREGRIDGSAHRERERRLMVPQAVNLDDAAI